VIVLLIGYLIFMFLVPRMEGVWLRAIREAIQ